VKQRRSALRFDYRLTNSRTVGKQESIRLLLQNRDITPQPRVKIVFPGLTCANAVNNSHEFRSRDKAEAARSFSLDSSQLRVFCFGFLQNAMSESLTAAVQSGALGRRSADPSARNRTWVGTDADQAAVAFLECEVKPLEGMIFVA